MERTANKARAVGDKQYFNGNPCKYGHIAPRYVSCGGCLVCRFATGYRSNEVANRKLKLEGRNRLKTRQLAQAKGKQFYFTGRKCDQGHMVLRYTSSGRCVQCRLNSQKAMRERPQNAEKQADFYRQWRENNRPHVNAQVRLRTLRKRQAVPPWADVKAIEQIYKKCPEGYHVDHIVPLQGKLASGLHVSENLQYLPAVENIVKRNRFEPIYE